jgi:hypothetical protein
MSVLTAYSDPLQEDEINEYKVKGIRDNFLFLAVSIFSSRHMMVLAQSCRAFVESLGQFRQFSKFWDRMDIFSSCYI